MTHRLDEPGVPLLRISGTSGLVATDVDLALISQEAIEELAGATGTWARVTETTPCTTNGELDFTESLRECVAILVGIPEFVFGGVLSAITPTKGVRKLVDAAHRAGGKLGIASGGFEEMVVSLVLSPSIDFYTANRLEVVDGVLMGRVLGRVVISRVKVECLRLWVSSLNIPLERTVVIGDGANDILMMHEAGVGIAFCAKLVAREQVPVQLSTPDLSLATVPLGLAQYETLGFVRVRQVDHVPIPSAVPGAHVLEDLRGVNSPIDLGGGLANIPPDLRVDDGAFRFGPSILVQGG